MYTDSSRSDFIEQIEYEQTALGLIYDAARPNLTDRPRSTDGHQNTFYINPEVEIEESVDPRLYQHQQDENAQPIGLISGSEGAFSGQGKIDTIVEGLVPLSFIMSYKHLDLLVEWILKEHHESGILDQLDDKVGFETKKDKMWSLISDDDLTLPSPLGEHRDVFNRLFSFYYRLQEARHAVVHRGDFEVDSGVFRASTDEEGSYEHEIPSEQVVELAKISIILGNMIEQNNIAPIVVQELKSRLDLMAEIHQEGEYGVAPVWGTQIHYFLEASSPNSGSWDIDLEQVREKESRVSGSNGFLLVLKAIYDRSQVEQWVIPSDHLEDLDEIEITHSGSAWEEFKQWSIPAGHFPS